MTIAAIVLAAGSSSRFGSDNKLLARVGAEPVVRRVLLELAKCPLDDIVVVVPSQATSLIEAAAEGPWRITVNPHAADGLSSSIRCGLSALGPNVDGALIVLADMPALSATIVTQVIAAFRADGLKRITFPSRADGRHGHPVMWPRPFFAALSALSGDAGGKSLIAAAGEAAQPIRIDDEGAYLDIDTPEELNAARSRLT